MPKISGRGKSKGRGRKRRQGVLGFVRPALLFLLMKEDAHGYALLDGLSEFGFDTNRVDPSLIYRILREMDEVGWVESYQGEESLGPQRRMYRISPAGKAYLAEQIDHLRHRRDEIDKLLTAYQQEVRESETAKSS